MTAPSGSIRPKGLQDGERERDTDVLSSPEVQVLVHAGGYELNEKDYRELYLLRERFGVEPPRALLGNVLAAA